MSEQYYNTKTNIFAPNKDSEWR